jgi:hypothetical protein
MRVLAHAKMERKKLSVSVRVRLEEKEMRVLARLKTRSHSHSFLVPGAGIEPAQHCCHWCLRPARLPIPPSGLICHAVVQVIQVLRSFIKRTACENRKNFYLFTFIFYLLFLKVSPLSQPQSPQHHTRTLDIAHPAFHAPQNNREYPIASPPNCTRCRT